MIGIHLYRHFVPATLLRAALLVAALGAPPSFAQSAPDPAAQALPGAATPTLPSADSAMQIAWEVRNRFRLFREERDFLLHADSMRGKSILASEQALELQSDGRGWSRNTVGRLCIDAVGHIPEACTRDKIKENYLAPAEHPITVRLTGAIPVGATCAWIVRRWRHARRSTLDCAEPINLRVRYGPTTAATVEVSSGPEAPVRVTTDIAVRDLLIAGLGDSIASGEGNPDRAIALSEEGFCFRSYLGGASGEFYRPGRAGYKGNRACEISPNTGNTLAVWQRSSALWFNSACHRSLYSYQTRTALALALQYQHIAVTYLPLACTGATIRRRAVRPAATARMSGRWGLDQMPERRQSAARGTDRSIERREKAPAQSHARPRAAHRRRERHQLLRPGLRRHRRQPDRARAVPARRRTGIAGRFTRGAGARTASILCELARRAQTHGRRSRARGLCVLRQSGAGGRRALPRRPRRLRYPSRLQRRAAAHGRASPTSCKANFCRSSKISRPARAA